MTDKLKVSVALQNNFSDIFYNKVKHAIFEWLNKNNINIDIWSELLDAVNEAICISITECMDSSGSIGPPPLPNKCNLTPCGDKE